MYELRNMNFPCDRQNFQRRWDTKKDGRLTDNERANAIRESCTMLGSQLTDREIGGNSHAQRLMKSLRGPPQLDDSLRALQQQSAQATVRMLKNKASYQARSCMELPEMPVARAGERITSRAMLLECRRAERMAALNALEIKQRSHTAKIGPRAE